jgi:hypothetical protein
MGSIVMTEIKVDNIVNVAGTGKPNFPVAPTHSTGSALSTLNTYQYDTTTRVVTVVDDNGTDKFAIDGVTAPTITLLRGVTYTFDVSDSSVSTHPLAFKNAGTSYTTGITSSGTAGTAGATVTFAVASDAPLTGLTYYCTTHGDGMGSSVTTSDPKNGALLWDGEVKFYIDSEFKAVGTSDSGGGSSSGGSNVFLGDRGVFLGDYNTSGAGQAFTDMDYIDITTTGNAVDFGDFTNGSGRYCRTCSNGSRILSTVFESAATNSILYITPSTPGNTSDFGDMTVTGVRGAAGDGDRGLFAGGSGTTYSDVIDYVAIATTGNAVDFGDLSTGARPEGISNATYAVFGLALTRVSSTFTPLNNLERVTVQTTGNSTDFGDLTVTRWAYVTGSDATRGCMAGGPTTMSSYTTSDVIDYITIATPGNATDFGNLTNNGRERHGGTSNSTRCVAGGGYSLSTPSSYLSDRSIDYWTTQTTGNASDFGDLIVARQYMGAGSGAAS